MHGSAGRVTASAVLALTLAVSTGCSRGSPGASPSGRGSASPTTGSPSPTFGEARLVIGTLLPQTGSLRHLGPATQAAAQLAVDDVNAAGGVLGRDVRLIAGDSGDTTTNVAVQTVGRLLDDKVDAVIGSLSSAVTLSVIDRITSAGVVQVSPGDSSVRLTTYPDRDLYARTAPVDSVTAGALARLVVDDGRRTAGLLVARDSSAQDFAAAFSTAFAAAGGTPAAPVLYDPTATDLTPAVTTVALTRPAAVVLVGGDESPEVVREMATRGIGPPALYLAPSNLSNALYTSLPDGLMAGAQGVVPGEAPDSTLRARLLAVEPSLVDLTDAAQTYDAVILVALAAEAARSTVGSEISARIAEVSTGGTTCRTFAACRDLVASGQDIDYVGLSGLVDVNRNGDLTSSPVSAYRYGPDNTVGAVPSRRFPATTG